MLKQARVLLLGLMLCSFGCSTVNAYSVQGSQVSLQDAGNYFSVKNAEAALQQIGAEIAGGVGGVYTFANSLVNTSGTVTLVGDQTTPGTNTVYSTNNIGVRGWNSAQSLLTIGNLTSSSAGLSISSGTNSVLGSGASVSITSGYYLPLTSDQTNWNLAYSSMLTASSIPTFAGLTLTGLNGVLQATGGVLSGSATLNALGAPTSSFSMNSQNLTNVLNPVGAQDAATKSYVDSKATGLAPKQAVNEATAGALPANTYNNGSSGVGATLTANSNGALTVDGIAVSLNDRILVKNEVTQANNGIYTVTTLGTPSVEYILTRATDTNTGTSILDSYVFINVGTVNGSTSWVNSNATAPTMGSTAITFVEFSSTPALTFTVPLVNTSGTVTINQAGTSTNGYLSSTNWNTFNGKQASLGNINGIVKGNGSGSYSAATAGTDYTTPTGTENLSNKTLGSTNTITALDNGFTLQNNSDNTKQVTFALSGITTGNTRVLTVPDSSITLVGTTNTQTLTGKTYDTAGAGNVLRINGTQISVVTGSGSVVLGTSPSLTTPSFASISNTGLLTLPTSTDTLIGRNTTDTFTNKTYDTAGSGNVFKINGTQITSVSGSTSKVATSSGTLTSGDCVKLDGSGNYIDAGAACGSGGGGSGVVGSGTAGQPTYYASTGTTVSGFAPLTYSTTFNGSSGVNIPVALAFTTTQSSSAGFTGIQENVTETSTGSGPHLLEDLQVGGISQFNVNDIGLVTAGQYKTNSTSAGEFDFYAPSSSFYTYLKAPSSLGATVGWTLPTADSVGYLQSNGSGVLSISTALGTPSSGTLTNATGLPSSGVLTKVVTVTAGATPTIVAVDNTDFEITGLATAITSMTTNLSGTTTNGATIEIDITDNATPRALTWGASFTTTGSIVIPTTTVASKRLRTWWQYNSTTAVWEITGSTA